MQSSVWKPTVLSSIQVKLKTQVHSYRSTITRLHFSHPTSTFSIWLILGHLSNTLTSLVQPVSHCLPVFSLIAGICLCMLTQNIFTHLIWLHPPATQQLHDVSDMTLASVAAEIWPRAVGGMEYHISFYTWSVPVRKNEWEKKKTEPNVL